MYCTPEDVKSELWLPLRAKMEQKFQALGEFDSFLGGHIVRAGDFVDAYLSKVFAVPFLAPVPSVIVTATAKLATYYAMAAFSEKEAVGQDKYDAAFAILEALADSGVMPGGASGGSLPGSLCGGGSTQVFTDEVLGEW